jgi:hypothetical protein
VRGTVAKAIAAAPPDGRAALTLTFTTIESGGTKQEIEARVTAVDNARESVDEQGQINGMLPSSTVSSRMDAGIGRLGQESSGLAGVLSGIRNAVIRAPSVDIEYGPGVEMTLRSKTSIKLPQSSSAPLEAMPDAPALAKIIAAQTYQTEAEKPRLPSDITNLLLIGEEQTVRQAFADAGWSAASGLTTKSKVEMALAAAEDRGYSEAPVSVLLLDGRPPDMVFEKGNNTVAQRHHLRIWQMQGTFQGMPLWAVAATHDIGIGFEESERTFIHKIDSQIDRERAKVTSDLVFTGRVRAIEMAERPPVPKHGRNATGDTTETDGRIAVLLFK